MGQDGKIDLITVGGEAVSRLGPATLFALLRDPATWPQWSFIDRFALERPGIGERDGLGAIRNFRTGPVLAREEVVELTPYSRFGYALLSGLPVHDYRANVDLIPMDGELTLVRWYASFRPNIPGTGWAMRIFLRDVLVRSVRALAAVDAARARAMLVTEQD